MNFERSGSPLSKMDIGVNRILKGPELIKEIIDLFWPDVKFEHYSREAGTPTKEALIEWAEYKVENNDPKDIQPDNLSLLDFGEDWDRY